jgi:hypothetical protein
MAQPSPLLRSTTCSQQIRRATSRSWRSQQMDADLPWRDCAALLVVTAKSGRSSSSQVRTRGDRRLRRVLPGQRPLLLSALPALRPRREVTLRLGPCLNDQRGGRQLGEGLRVRRYTSWPRGHSSAGRALAWHARGRRFEPGWLHSLEAVEDAVVAAAHAVQYEVGDVCALDRRPLLRSARELHRERRLRAVDP